MKYKIVFSSMEFPHGAISKNFFILLFAEGAEDAQEKAIEKAESFGWKHGSIRGIGAL